MAEEYHPGKYLAQITKKCRELTVSEMLRNADEVIRKNRLGFGHYMFDGAHAPKDKWTIPGALDYEVLKSADGVEVLFKAGHFHKEELSVQVPDTRMPHGLKHPPMDVRRARPHEHPRPDVCYDRHRLAPCAGEGGTFRPILPTHAVGIRVRPRFF